MTNAESEATFDPGSGDGTTFEDRLVRAQLSALNRQGRTTNPVPPINSLVLAAILWGIAPTPVLIG
jgi:hypothetical protein